jgi:hypothetical protein
MICWAKNPSLKLEKFVRNKNPQSNLSRWNLSAFLSANSAQHVCLNVKELNFPPFLVEGNTGNNFVQKTEASRFLMRIKMGMKVMQSCDFISTFKYQYV